MASQEQDVAKQNALKATHQENVKIKGGESDASDETGEAEPGDIDPEVIHLPASVGSPNTSPKQRTRRINGNASNTEVSPKGVSKPTGHPSVPPLPLSKKKPVQTQNSRFEEVPDSGSQYNPQFSNLHSWVVSSASNKHFSATQNGSVAQPKMSSKKPVQPEKKGKQEAQKLAASQQNSIKLLVTGDSIEKKKTADVEQNFDKLKIEIREIDSKTIEIRFVGEARDFFKWLKSHQNLRDACDALKTTNPQIAQLKLKGNYPERDKTEISSILKSCNLRYVPHSTPALGLNGESHHAQNGQSGSISNAGSNHADTSSIMPPLLFRDITEPSKSPRSKKLE